MSSNKTRTVMTCIANQGPITGAMVARTSGLTEPEVHRIISRSFQRGRISRAKVDAKAYYRYCMTDEQRARFLRFAFGDFSTETLVADAVDIPARLRFLESLKQTVHRDNPVLDAIINDYRRTLKHFFAG